MSKRNSLNAQRGILQHTSLMRRYLSSITFWTVFLILILIDRLTKLWATQIRTTIDYGVVSFHYVTNTGAGFGILQGSNTLLLVIALIIFGILMYARASFPRIGLVFICSGLVGNVIDRITLGFVIDFIDFKFWPVFNAADTFIVIGVVVTCIHILFKMPSKKKRENVYKTIR